MTTGTFEMDWLTNAIQIGAGVVVAIIVLALLVAIADAVAQDIAGAQAIRAVTHKPVGRSYCPLCLFDLPLGMSAGVPLPTDRWMSYAFIGDAVPCQQHAAKYARMAHNLWTPEWYEAEPLLEIYVTEDVDVSDVDTHELPEVGKAS